MNDAVLTLDKLKATMALAPRPIGYALIVPSRQIVVDTIYKLARSEFMPGDALYWLVVPHSFLVQAVEQLGAVPSDDIPGEAYRFNVFSLLKDDIG